MKKFFQPRELCEIGFVSIRFSGTDGVTLETEKWVEVLEGLGHTCYFFTGISDQPPERTFLVPEANFKHPDIAEINETAFSKRSRPPEITRRIHEIKDHLKKQLYIFTEKFEIDLLIVENALTIPINIPLGLALTEFIMEAGFPTIAHHHDFFWERKRFLNNCVWDYLNMAFPPRLPCIEHVVINSSGANQLSLRTGASSTLIPNVMNFEKPVPPPDEYAKNLRLDLGILPDEYLFLQPTRVVQRKGIEHSIELVHRLGEKARIVISHASGDEGYEYEQHVREFAKLLNVPVNFESDIIDDRRGQNEKGQKIYSVQDVYQYADFVTYPSSFEGFGNAFLEAIYFKRPIVINNYAIYSYDIRPKGFKTVEFDGFISNQTVEDVRYLLEHPDVVREIVEENYRIASHYFSYSMLERQLKMMLARMFGVSSLKFKV